MKNLNKLKTLMAMWNCFNGINGWIDNPTIIGIKAAKYLGMSNFWEAHGVFEQSLSHTSCEQWYGLTNKDMTFQELHRYAMDKQISHDDFMKEIEECS